VVVEAPEDQFITQNKIVKMIGFKKSKTKKKFLLQKKNELDLKRFSVGPGWRLDPDEAAIFLLKQKKNRHFFLFMMVN